MTELKYQLKVELEDKMYRAKRECQYNPTRFNQMLAKYGAVETAKRLISKAIPHKANPSHVVHDML